MGKELFFIRHSLAREAFRGQADNERELSESGSIRAMQLASFLHEKGVKPDALLSSAAVRARTTAELLAEKILGPGKEVVFHDDLYESSVRLMLSLINQLEEKWKQVVIIGHNPVLPYTVEYLTGNIVETLEAGGVLRLTTEADKWAEISGKTMDLQEYIAPAVYAQV
ncbi:SixA phosphatase family protein [Nafulsella turpanensis]|uniref:SixA phosphatase family protein n=1 Tax=Nafulsella turpanensis TaxID=1265690 RepID=UPI00034D7C20|nr:histidine phosphatase family protein [Nafulsella turpanensis]